MPVVLASLVVACSYPDAQFSPADVAVDSAKDDANATDTRVRDDDALDPDGSLDSPPIDTGPVTNCSRAGTTCDVGQICTLPWTLPTNKYSLACGPNGTLKLMDVCTLYFTTASGCVDGYTCGPLYGPTTLFARCLPLCDSSSDCPAETPFCNTPVEPPTFKKMKHCGQCRPYVEGDCEAGKSCVVTSHKAPPTCSVAGSHSEGQACSASATCGPGLACACASGGTTMLGDDCAATSTGVCRQMCEVVGASPCSGGLSCTRIGTTAYAACM